MINVIDPGHKYELLVLDCKLPKIRQTLTFVKRHDTKNPEKYPGNIDSYPGTNIQSVLHCLLNRIRYLNNQIPDPRNSLIKQNLQQCLWLLEDRAASRKGRIFNIPVEDLEFYDMCSICGHVRCEHAL